MLRCRKPCQAVSNQFQKFSDNAYVIFVCFRNALNVVKDDLIAQLDEILRYVRVGFCIGFIGR
jgi:hypothetical protein